MGRTRAKTKKIVPPITTTPAEKPTPPSIPSLLEKARTLIDQCDYELAKRFLHRILEQSPADVATREMMGVVQLELGEIDAARKIFLSLVPPSHDAPSPPPPSAHLYLAQLSDDDPHMALQHYRAAIDIFTLQLKGKDRAVGGAFDGDESELKTNIVRALVGMVEIWMDPSYDLCFEEKAEQTCEEILNEALEVDSGNAEALQAFASVRLSQQRSEEAREYLEKAWAKWKDLDSGDSNLPSIPTRLSMVKLFLELSLFTPALQVLHGIMSADDQEVEAWYLEGWCFFLMSEQAKDSGKDFDGLTWEELAKDARDCLETCKILHVNEEYADKPLLEHTKELIAQLDALGITPSLLEEGEGEEKGEWEDLDGSEDEDGDVEMG